MIYANIIATAKAAKYSLYELQIRVTFFEIYEIDPLNAPITINSTDLQLLLIYIIINQSIPTILSNSYDYVPSFVKLMAGAFGGSP